MGADAGLEAEGPVVFGWMVRPLFLQVAGAAVPVGFGVE